MSVCKYVVKYVRSYVRTYVRMYIFMCVYMSARQHLIGWEWRQFSQTDSRARKDKGKTLLYQISFVTHLKTDLRWWRLLWFEWISDLYSTLIQIWFYFHLSWDRFAATHVKCCPRLFQPNHCHRLHIVKESLPTPSCLSPNKFSAVTYCCWGNLLQEPFFPGGLSTDDYNSRRSISEPNQAEHKRHHNL